MNIEQAVDQVISQVKQIHPNLAVLSRLSNQLNDPNTGMDDIADLIASEPSLTADIISISNSALYGASVECDNVESALARIGFNDVLRVVSLLMSKSLCSKRLEYYDIGPHQMWAESVTVSFFMEGFSSLAGLNKAKAATTGVLHNVGRVLTNDVLEMFGHQVEWDGLQPIAEWEQEQIGIHYGEAGARFLQDMSFPEEIQDIVSNHVFAGSVSRENPLCQLLHYSVLLIKRVGLGFCNPEYKIPTLMHLQPQFNLNEEDIADVIEEAKVRYHEINTKVLTGG